ncbi:MAG: hypothetical protein Q7O66_10280 [Dehalococcoidia bacterium]|nr:hypothetical protein [Dehalococcoidia bacterium]
MPLGPKKVGALKGYLSHYNYLEKMNRHTDLEARMLRQRGLTTNWRNCLWFLGLKPAAFFLYLYVYQRGYIDGMVGLLYDVLSVYYVFVKYAKCWKASSSAACEIKETG